MKNFSFLMMGNENKNIFLFIYLFTKLLNLLMFLFLADLFKNINGILKLIIFSAKSSSKDLMLINHLKFCFFYFKYLLTKTQSNFHNLASSCYRKTPFYFY